MPITTQKYLFTKQSVDAAPIQHGAYALYRNGGVIYYGRAIGDGVTIRSRLQQHQSGATGPCTASADTYNYEVCGDGGAREAFLLREFFAAHGRLPDCNERFA